MAIETEFVSSALKEFVERYEFVKKEKASSNVEKAVLKEKVTVSRNIIKEDITYFWKQYQKIFSSDGERLWDNLLVGLKKYYEVLKERHELNAEIEFLRKQNVELRRLLRNYSEEVILINKQINLSSLSNYIIHNFQPHGLELSDEEMKLVQSIMQD